MTKKKLIHEIVLEAMKKSGKALTKKRIMQRTGLNKGQVDRSCTVLRKMGYIGNQKFWHKMFYEQSPQCDSYWMVK